MRKLIIIILTCTFLFSCNRNENIPDGITEIPLITNFSASDNKFHFKDTASKVYFRFTIWDKDKDFGTFADDSSIVIEDYRSGELFRVLNYPVPTIPREVLKRKYLEAKVNVPLKSVFFTPRPDSLHIMTRKDTAVFKIWVKDEGGNKSNIIKTDTFYIQE